MTSQLSPRAGGGRPLPARSGYHHGNLRSALVQAAVGLVREKGPYDFNLAEAARRVGVSVAAPYRHFDDREALLAEVAHWGYEQLRDALDAVPAEADDPVGGLVALGLAYIRFAERDPRVFQLMFSLEERAPAADAGRDALGVLQRALERADAAGEISVDVDLALRVTWGLAHGVAMLKIGDMATFRSERPEHVAEVLRAAFTGIMRHG
ncbi:TetR/AcrR family transcriptional regulator [Phytoactinopolyspora halotolerans]|uniref:TetR/AcrR family transcriptional regulator n=1 Tax=Phytoactinopolyspora halotolerans TaxID=1981512 RepID=A0A6L9S273_9ACTN|nr:TetR/AcrR family transcriptional regulator [Phytoactinopolyspora halotolerans]NED99182.1 TetR/AcrR family transcriptional regulator [Phytoactinopolyspora halotolerans]